MKEKQAEKTQIAASKSFMAVGPTLHYSHKNVLSCWLLAVVAFGLCGFFWSKILTGSFWLFDGAAVVSPSLWRLDEAVMSGVSIFEYPWQILVLGLLMGVLAVAPVLISQLMSFGYSVPFILEVFFLANLPGFGICLLISCIAVACRPLRFRSRFIAIALCTAPQLVYWGFFGGLRDVEPIAWGFSFAPWIVAWLIALAIASLVLGIGHFTRYRPGLVWIFTTVFLLLAVVTFEMRIGFDELDYQLYVARNNPEDVIEFHDHSITAALDDTIKDPVARGFLSGPFYSPDEIELRVELKRVIQAQLSGSGWPSWFVLPAELDYQPKRQWLLSQYDLFRMRRPNSRRRPVALYYEAMLKEYSPDTELLGQKEVLHFYSDYPQESARDIWSFLYAHKDFGKSPESIEARWRVAKHLAGQGRFEQADELLAEAEIMAAARLKLLEQESAPSETFLGLFRGPSDSVMTKVKLEQLQPRLKQLRSLIGLENRTDNIETQNRLATFVMLNPHASDYGWHLEELLEQTKGDDPLRDNILLAKAKLIADDQGRGERLAALHKEFEGTDGGLCALYELARLKISQYQEASNQERKKEYLTEARALLTSFISLYPNSFHAERATKMLEELPKVD